MVWTPDLDFNTGDYLEGTELDQVNANALHARTEANYRVLAVCAETPELSNSSGFGNYNDADVTLKISTVDGVAQTGDGSKTDKNTNISGLSNGIHTLSLYVDGDYGDGTLCTFRFYKTDDLDYVSIYFTIVCRSAVINEDTYYYIKATDVSIIGHREAIA